MWRGIDMDDSMLARDLIHAEGPGGNYLANEHTAKYCRRERWDSRYFEANYPRSSGRLRDEDLVERIERELQEILLNHHPEALAPETIGAMRTIADSFRNHFKPGA
jgi:trimethylamine--corrinoid protein Co-methyltransferase